MRAAGIHHITAIVGDPTRNFAFDMEALGLRAVKRTVDLDDPGRFDFDFGDEIERLAPFFAPPMKTDSRAAANSSLKWDSPSVP